LEEYGITEKDNIRVVATSAVREASNQLAFLDRIYIATGIEIESIDEAEVNRITYLGVQAFLKSSASRKNIQTLITEVGGGSTEILLVKKGSVAYSHTYRMGSLRLRRMIEDYRAPMFKVRSIMENQIQRTIQQIHLNLKLSGPVKLIAIGGDIRFAVSQLIPDWDREQVVRIPLQSIEEFTDEILTLSEGEIVRKFHLNFPNVETLGPALLTYVMLAKALNLDQVTVTNTNLRDGLLQDMAVKDSWSDDFHNQVIRSALDLGRKYRFDQTHARHVAELSRKLFRKLSGKHHLDTHYEVILYVAALLHETGSFISSHSMHKHSMYIIQHSELFGLGKKDLLLVAMVARYHRRASPQPGHEGYATLNRDERVVVAKLAAILRIGVALDESRSQRIQDFDCESRSGTLIIVIPNVEDLSLEKLALSQSGSLFEEIFGKKIVLRITGRERSTSELKSLDV
jgi:exopolyphosphatase/guanosine-5'-triphosphate,3'-diphosphate pyrophosphatase